MAVETYGVTYTDLDDYLPFDVALLTEDDWITPSMMTEWIEKGGARMTGLLVKAGIGFDALDDNSQAIVQEGVLLGAAISAMNKIGQTGAQFDNLKTRRDEVERRLAAQPGTLPARPTTIESNIPDECDALPLQFGRKSGW